MRLSRFTLFLLSSCALAQSFETPVPTPQSRDRAAPATREELLIEEREHKAESAKPPELEKAEEIFLKVQRIVDIVFGQDNGFGVRLGGLVTGSGFSAGPEYRRSDLFRENLRFRASAVGSIRGFYALDTLLSLPHLASDRVQLDLYGRHRDLRSMPYYGPGPKSFKSLKTDYRLEDTNGDFRLGVRPTRHLLLGATGGILLVNVGPGTADYPDTSAIFTPAQTPGVLEQTSYLRGGPFLQFDTRDFAGDPHRGWNVESRFEYYRDRDRKRYTFRRLDSSVQKYVPFFNRKRVIALRAATYLTFDNRNNQVPFYMQPTLGGSDDLRGFEAFRFYGNNAMIYTAEYRFEVATPLDVAVFTDAGKVFNRPGQFSHRDLEYSGGIGFRIKSRSSVVTRLDVGISREGIQIWFKFGNVFEPFFPTFLR